MTSFLKACGILDSLKLIVEGPNVDQAAIRLLQQPFAVIGRNLRADVVLDHAQVSRRHVYLQMIEGRAFWIDLGSRTGTRMGKRLQKLGWLDGGRTLGIGPYEIRLSNDVSQNDNSNRSLPPHGAPFLVNADRDALMPEVALEFLNGPSRSTRWPVRRVMSLLGSASGCKLRLADPSVSRFHASLVRTPTGLWVIDLLGQGGISVNSVPLRFSRLDDADVLEVGRYQMRVQYGWQYQDTGNRSLDSTLRLQNREPNPVGLGGQAGTAIGFAPESGSSGEAAIPLLPQPLSLPASVEILPSDRAYAIKPGQSGSADSMLVPLVNQFGLMQQQMFDQFQQAMSMLVQMFGKMHRDQMDVIRVELDRLHELTDELQSLKDELARRAQPQPVSDEPRRNSAVSDPRGHSRGEDLTGSSPVYTPTSKSQKGAVDRPSSSSAAVGTGSTPPLPQYGASGERISGKVDLGSAANTEKDAIIWLHQRIASIQSERESRWQKILKLLPGAS